MSEENMSGSKTPKILGAVIAIAAVVGVIGWFANRGTADATTVATTNVGKLQTTGIDPKVETTTTTATTKEEKGGSGTTSATTVTTSPSSPSANPGSSTAVTTPTPETTSPYKDGTYSASGSYQSPAGQETVDVSLTVKAGIITETSFTGTATNPASKNWQNVFDQGYKSLVVGKPIDGLSLTVVNGASLTPKGFMDAVQKIKADAQS